MTLAPDLPPTFGWLSRSSSPSPSGSDWRSGKLAKSHLEELARANPNALVVLLHHTSKAAERGEGSPIHAGRGSSILCGWTDVQLNLTHHPTPPRSGLVAFKALVAKARDGERGQSLRFTVSLGEGTITIEEVAEANAQERAADVREVVAASSEPLTKSQLANEVGGRRQTIMKLIDEMAERGDLKKTSSGRYALGDETVQENGS